MPDRWLEWSRTLLTIAQEGLAYSRDPFERARCEKLRSLAADMAGHGAEEDAGRIRGLFARDEGYATPKVDVRGVAFREDRVLLVSERMDGGRWALPGISLAVLAWLALLMAVVGLLGDLFESMLKRQAQVKDASEILPGHGGMLDRLDSLLFTAPLVVYVRLFLIG